MTYDEKKHFMEAERNIMDFCENPTNKHCKNIVLECRDLLIAIYEREKRPLGHTNVILSDFIDGNFIRLIELGIDIQEVRRMYPKTPLCKLFVMLYNHLVRIC